MEGFTAVVALEEEGEAGGGRRPFGVCLGRVKLPPLVENGEQRPFGHGQRIEAVVRLIVIQPQRQGGQVVNPQPESEEEDGEEGEAFGHVRGAGEQGEQGSKGSRGAGEIFCDLWGSVHFSLFTFHFLLLTFHHHRFPQLFPCRWIVQANAVVGGCAYGREQMALGEPIAGLPTRHI